MLMRDRLKARNCTLNWIETAPLVLRHSLLTPLQKDINSVHFSILQQLKCVVGFIFADIQNEHQSSETLPSCIEAGRDIIAMKGRRKRRRTKE